MPSKKPVYHRITVYPVAQKGKDQYGALYKFPFQSTKGLALVMTRREILTAYRRGCRFLFTRKQYGGKVFWVAVGGPPHRKGDDIISYVADSAPPHVFTPSEITRIRKLQKKRKGVKTTKYLRARSPLLRTRRKYL